MRLAVATAALLLTAGCRTAPASRDAPAREATLATGTDSALAHEAVLEGWERLDAGEHEAALRNFEKASRVDPEGTIALAHRAALERGTEGDALLSRAEDLVRGRPEGERVQVEILRATRAGDSARALELQGRLAELYPEAARARYLYGKRLSSFARYPEAVAELERATELDPERAPAHFLAAWILAERMDEAHRALPHLARHLELRPNDAAGWETLSSARSQSGDSTGAEAAARRAIEIDAARANARYRLTRALAQQGRIDDMRAELERFVPEARDDQVIRVRVELAWVLFALGRGAAAEARLSEAEHFAATSDFWRIALHAVRGAMHSLSGEWDAALVALASADREANAASGNDCRPEVSRMVEKSRVRALARRGEGERALTELRARIAEKGRLLTGSMTTDLVSFGEGEAALARGDLPAARAAFERCSAADDWCAWTLATMPGAGEEARRAVELHVKPTSAYPYFRSHVSRD